MRSLMSPRSKLELPPLNLGSESIGQRLRRLRKARGLTQTEIAKKIGIIQALVSDYERERLRLHAEMLARFALALSVSTDEIIGLEKQEAAGELPSRRFIKRLKQVGQLSKRDQDTLLRTIDAFLRGSDQ